MVEVSCFWLLLHHILRVRNHLILILALISPSFIDFFKQRLLRLKFPFIIFIVSSSIIQRATRVTSKRKAFEDNKSCVFDKYEAINIYWTRNGNISLKGEMKIYGFYELYTKGLQDWDLFRSSYIQEASKVLE